LDAEGGGAAAIDAMMIDNGCCLLFIVALEIIMGKMLFVFR
jgi:hypothetical protein